MYKLWKQGALNFPEILAVTYKNLGLDERTYTFLVLFARLIKENPTDWSLAQITKSMTVDEQTCSQIFMMLIHDGFLMIKNFENEQGVKREIYSLEPLFLKIETVLKQEAASEKTNDLVELSSKLEQIFGVLSARDIELVGYWMSEDGFDVSLIELALSEMQMHDIRSLKYVDKILLDWKRKNIYTVDEAKKSLIDFRRAGTYATAFKDEKSTENPKAYYNWIEQIKKGLK